MPQKDILKRQEYNKLQYLKNKEKTAIKLDVKPTPTLNVLDNYCLLKFFKNIQQINNEFINIKLKPVVNKVDNLKEAIIIELKKYHEDNKNKFESIRFKYKYIMIDFKLSMKLKLLIQNLEEPKYKGYCYNVFYVKRVHTKIINFYFSDYVKYYNYLSTKEEYKKYREIEDYYKINCPDYKDEVKLSLWLSDNQYKEERIMKFYINSYSRKPTGYNTIKIREPSKQIDYYKTPRYHYNAKNIKFFDKIALKPTNRGLEANHLYTDICKETNHKRGWKFNGITLDEIKKFCEINGMIISKNYNYGDYANWILKVLY